MAAKESITRLKTTFVGSAILGLLIYSWHYLHNPHDPIRNGKRLSTRLYEQYDPWPPAAIQGPEGKLLDVESVPLLSEWLSQEMSPAKRRVGDFFRKHLGKNPRAFTTDRQQLATLALIYEPLDSPLLTAKLLQTCLDSPNTNNFFWAAYALSEMLGVSANLASIQDQQAFARALVLAYEKNGTGVALEPVNKCLYELNNAQGIHGQFLLDHGTERDLSIGASLLASGLKEKAVPVLISRLSSTNLETVRSCAHTLGYLGYCGYTSQATLPTLSNLLSHVDPEIVNTASNAIKYVIRGNREIASDRTERPAAAFDIEKTQ